MAKRNSSSRGKKKSQSRNTNWRRSPITGAIASLIIIVCLYNIFFDDNSIEYKKYKMDLLCNNEECKFEKRMPSPDGEKFSPYTCPKCGQKELYSAEVCSECKKHTPLLPPKIDMTCSSCEHHEVGRYDPAAGPHACPECQQKTFLRSYQCEECKTSFGFAGKIITLDGGKTVIDRMEIYHNIECPKCKKEKANPITLEPETTCKYCDSVKMSSITPKEVIFWELGKELKPNQQKIVDEWLEEHGEK